MSIYTYASDTHPYVITRFTHNYTVEKTNSLLQYTYPVLILHGFGMTQQAAQELSVPFRDTITVEFDETIHAYALAEHLHTGKSLYKSIAETQQTVYTAAKTCLQVSSESSLASSEAVRTLQSISLGGYTDVCTALRALKHLVCIQKRAVHVMGYSRGGATLLRTLDALRHPDRYAALLATSGVSLDEAAEIHRMFIEKPVSLFLIHPLLDMRSIIASHLPGCTKPSTNIFKRAWSWCATTCACAFIRLATRIPVEERQPIHILDELAHEPYYNFSIACCDHDTVVGTDHHDMVRTWINKRYIQELPCGTSHGDILAPWAKCIALLHSKY